MSSNDQFDSPMQFRDRIRTHHRDNWLWSRRGGFARVMSIPNSQVPRFKFVGGTSVIPCSHKRLSPHEVPKSVDLEDSIVGLDSTHALSLIAPTREPLRNTHCNVSFRFPLPSNFVNRSAMFVSVGSLPTPISSIAAASLSRESSGWLFCGFGECPTLSPRAGVRSMSRGSHGLHLRQRHSIAEIRSIHVFRKRRRLTAALCVGGRSQFQRVEKVTFAIAIGSIILGNSTSLHFMACLLQSSTPT